MEDFRQYKNVKRYITSLHKRKLEKIISIVCEEIGITQARLLQNNKVMKDAKVADAKRKIVYIARILNSISGNTMANRLSTDVSWVSELIWSTFETLKEDKEYRAEVEALMDKCK